MPVQTQWGRQCSPLGCSVDPPGRPEQTVDVPVPKVELAEPSATVHPDKSASVFAVATIIGYLDFWGQQEVMIKCDQEQSAERIAELLQERRRPRRTIVVYSPKESHLGNRVVENAHYHLEGLVRTLRSDLMEKTGVNVNVKSLLAPWLLRHCAWSLTRFAIGADGQTAFKRRRGKDYVAETACFGEAICYRIPLRIQTKMEPRWEADGVFLGKLDLSDEVIFWDTPRESRQHCHSDG